MDNQAEYAVEEEIDERPFGCPFSLFDHKQFGHVCFGEPIVRYFRCSGGRQACNSIGRDQADEDHGEDCEGIPSVIKGCS